MDNYFINQGIKYTYVSSSLGHLKDRFIEKYGLKEITSKNKNDCKKLIIFGMYTDKDRVIYTMFRNIERYIIFGGNDLSGNKKKLNMELLKNQSLKAIYSISQDIKCKLDDMKVNNIYLNLNLVNKEIFNIKIDKTKSTKIYIYNGLANNVNKKNRENIYGKEYYVEIMKRLPQYEYILSNEKYHSYEEMPYIYSECFIGLRLTKDDGNANMVQEMEQMSIPVVHNSSEYGLKWETVYDIIKHIKDNDKNNKELIDNNRIGSLDDFNCIYFEYDIDYDNILLNTKGNYLNELNLIKNIKDNNKHHIYVNKKYIHKIDDNIKNKCTIVRGINSVKKKNIIKPKFSFMIPYDTECDKIYCLTQSWIDAMNDKNSLLYPNVYSYKLYNEIINKSKILIKQDIKKEWYNWKSNDEIIKLKNDYYNSNSFVIGICGRIAINNYPNSLLGAIKRLRNNGINVQLLILGEIKNNVYRLSEYEYNEIRSYDWIKFMTVPKKEVLNYYRICDVLASTIRDYGNNVCGSNKIKEFKLVDRPILCSRGIEKEVELGEKYYGFYNCKTVNTIPPLDLTEKFIKNPFIMNEYYEDYFKELDLDPDENEVDDIYNILFSINAKILHNKNKKNKSILIYQESLGIRSWKYGYMLYIYGYDISYSYFRYDFNFNYDKLNDDFVSEYYKFNNTTDYLEFGKLLKKYDNITFINAWENFAVKSIDINPIYYIGDLQILRHKFIKNGINNISCINEKKILNNSSKIIFSNKYIPEKIEKDFNIKLKNYNIVQNSFITNNFNPKIRDYSNKKYFKLVYFGSIENNVKNHRYIHNLLIELSKLDYIELHIYPTLHNNNKLKNIFSNHKIIIHNTINQHKIIETLNIYDYGICLFNTDYDDNEYLDISQPNKFFDYYFSNLPIICNNTISFKDFVENNKIGICINSINDIKIQKLQKVYFEEFNKINTYNEEIYNIMPLLNKIEYIYISNGLSFFKDKMLNKFNLKNYDMKKIDTNCLFFGMYYKEDYDKLINHKGNKYLLLGGSDTKYNYFNSIINNLIYNKIIIICQSKHIYDYLLDKYTKKYLWLCPVTPVIIENFYEPNNIKGNSIYIYTSDKKSEIYGKSIYDIIIERLKEKYNFIICTAHSYKNIKDIYKKCFVGLRLTNFDGLGATNIELGLMGIKSITNNISPNCLKWETVEDIIEHIENEAKNIGKSDNKLANDVYNFIKQENIIFS